MIALKITCDGLEYTETASVPVLDGHFDVLVKVAYAGICRTDIGIAHHEIQSKADIVSGHEFCGRIVAFNNGDAGYGDLRLDDVVSADPMSFGVGTETMCGKDCDGCFAEYVAVPHKAVIKLCPGLCTPLGAFLEPVAAALAPYKHIGCMEETVAVYGRSRIAELTYRVGVALGFCNLTMVSGNELPANSYDAIIETEPDCLPRLVGALRHGGKLIVKSRSFRDTRLVPNDIAMKEICIQGARYGDFHHARNLLADSGNGNCDGVDFASIFGESYSLCDFAEAFEAASDTGAKKIFFKICAE